MQKTGNFSAFLNFCTSAFPMKWDILPPLMDATLEIKAKLPIEELVGQYCQLKKKGRGFVCLCPFHQDTHPSMQVSPDKGIAYCFACSKGGDIFSFYQEIEGVDFRQALKDLGEKTGVKVEGLKMEKPVEKDHKVRIRECLQEAEKFYKEKLSASEPAKSYLASRSITQEQIEQFGLGVAPDSFSDTYQHLLKAGFSRKEIVDASLGIQKDLSDEKIYDRFRNRLMFPIHDGSGDIVGFGGRTLADDDAKYINSGDTPLYNKSVILYGLHYAKEAIRESKTVILVEGYFDVLACHKVGMKNTVAVSGTALTEQHVKLLKRYAEKVVLCLDQDRAGRDAAERSFMLCSAEGLNVHAVTLNQKDPDEAANADPDGLKHMLEEGGKPYIDCIIHELSTGDVTSPDGKQNALKTLIPLLESLSSSVLKEHYMARIAALLSTTETALQEDIEAGRSKASVISHQKSESGVREKTTFTAAEIAMGIMLHFPKLTSEIKQLIEPEDLFASALYHALKDAPAVESLTLEMLTLPEEHRERASILLLYCEHLGFSEWSESLAVQELRKNCTVANRTLLRKKQTEIALKLQNARQEGNSQREAELSQQYQQVLKLAKMAN